MKKRNLRKTHHYYRSPHSKGKFKNFQNVPKSMKKDHFLQPNNQLRVKQGLTEADEKVADTERVESKDSRPEILQKNTKKLSPRRLTAPRGQNDPETQ